MGRSGRIGRGWTTRGASCSEQRVVGVFGSAPARHRVGRWQRGPGLGPVDHVTHALAHAGVQGPGVAAWMVRLFSRAREGNRYLSGHVVSRPVGLVFSVGQDCRW
uniref:Uncharacterized protein n=1 Tax=Setaria viridis TaxID=4556 RepID=A0A4U6WQH6_SETVI|nr:hypothetical protein SEVIR_1G293950v2 [Setaria viridis]